MVHNGIEYGDMQLICEAYHLMKDVLGMQHDEMSKVISSFISCFCEQRAVPNIPELPNEVGSSTHMHLNVEVV